MCDADESNTVECNTWGLASNHSFTVVALILSTFQRLLEIG